MEINCNFNEIADKFGDLLTKDDVAQAMGETGVFVEKTAKHRVNTFKDRKGHQQGVDSGDFRDGIHASEKYDGYGFSVADSVDYGIYHEFGTERHFVPFFDESGTLTSLGQWAMRHFDKLDFEVIGKSGKALKKPNRASREEVLKKRKGIMVQLDEMAPLRTSLDQAPRELERIIKEIINNGESNSV